jgi:mRNA-degrading endonuclease HigB of HigAB toxin-antitoxin module
MGGKPRFGSFLVIQPSSVIVFKIDVDRITFQPAECDPDWATPADVKDAIRSVSVLRDGRAVFNVAGNKYRIVVWINHPYRVVYIRFVGTHRQYDAIDAQTIWRRQQWRSHRSRPSAITSVP